MKRILAASFALVLLLALAACGSSSGGGGGGGGNACPSPAEFDHSGCAFDDAGTLFGP
ncbi:MAG TPA: branched-chain amino acid ABC transporter substrate-binding protein [Oceanithermus profundus]|uniref:Branched-chain amino acid ABC transporter substrate-binding protein n=1 Tax=Oceanithermus profundus TaxID=187137 RepID=A0A7C4V619_9DEIN|nr:branched-chain amino acid ABC transporter substrate-binding protein [Oceanithermus profundus]